MAALALLCPAAGAHVLDASAAASPFAWNDDPLVAGLLALALVLYAIGYRRLAARSQRGLAVRRRQAGAFLLGWGVLAVALVSPLDTLGGWLFSAHMLQHELMMLLAAPLLVLGRPLGTWVWAFGPRTRWRLGRIVHARAVAAPWRLLGRPTVAWALHAVALWGWHVPRFFEAALARPAVHAAQHASFLASALLFWWSVLPAARRPGQGGAAMLSVFTTMVHTGALGALLTLAPGLWYPPYAATAPALGFDPLEDQQLGGLVMWVPGGLAYLVGGLVIVARLWVERRPAAPAIRPVRPS